MKTGLILEGGAMRGMFTAGVTDVWMEHGVTFDGAVGVSAGAVFGCNYKSHQPGRALRYNLTYCNDKRYASFHNLLHTGDLYSEQFCYHDIPEKLDPFDAETFAASPMEFFVVCTELRTGDPVYHKCRTGGPEDLKWMQASASMPLAARTVQVGHHKLLDGGIADSIPVRFLESIGYRRNVIVLTQPKGYEKEEQAPAPHPGPVRPLPRLCGGGGRPARAVQRDPRLHRHAGRGGRGVCGAAAHRPGDRRDGA